MENNNEQFQQSQSGSGSSENKGGDRRDQMNRSKDLNEKDKQKVADDINENPASVSSVEDMGTLSGRDDYAGGDNDGMDEQNSRENTER